jgi:tetratricopeptide (TPR) repeat protein
MLASALAIEPQFADALTLLGLIKMQNQELQAAQGYFERAVHIDPTASRAYVGLGVIYNHQARYDDAMRASERAQALSPRSWQGYFEMARASIGQGMYQKALQFAKQAEKLGGDKFAALHLTKACALVSLKFYKEAKAELQTFLSREPKGAGAEQAQNLLAQIDAGHDTTIASAH